MNYKNLIFALKCTVLTSATTHLIILAANSFVTKNYEQMNLFNILDLELIFPGIDKGPVMFWWSVALGFVIFSSWLVYSVYKQKRKSD